MKRVIVCLLVLVVCTVASASFDSPGKVFEWAFEGNATDTAGTASGTWAGTTAYGAGRWGQAAALNGSSTIKGALGDSVMELFNGYDADGDGEADDYEDHGWTMNLWVNMAVADISDWAIIAGVGNDNDLNGRFFHQSGLNTVQYSGFGPWGWSDTTGYALNDWTMVTASVKYGTTTLYVDGVKQVGNHLDTWFNAPDLTENNVMAGMPNKWTTTKFSGLLDEFTIWDGPMTADQVSSMFATNTIPEPATLALLGFGALSLIRRKK